MAESTLKLEIDTEKFRVDLKAMVDELVEQATQSLDTRIRMIVRDDMDRHFAQALRDHRSTRG